MSPRNGATGIWTGELVLVFGGTTTPTCQACEIVSAATPLLDGAAYDPEGNTWRLIAPVPSGIAHVVDALSVGDEIFVLGHTSELWSYSISTDRWSQVQRPPDAPSSSMALTGDGRLVFAHTEITTDRQRDYWFDLENREWSPVPRSPFELGWIDRSYLAVGSDLVLFANPSPAALAPGSPGVVSAAILDQTSHTWRRIDDSDQLAAPYFAEGSTAINPDRGGSDGGEVNNWGRLVSNGGRLDLESESWSAMAANDGGRLAGGVIGDAAAAYKGIQGDVYDLAGDGWVTLPALPNGHTDEGGITVVAVGLDVFVFGGFDPRTPSATVTNDAFVLDIDRGDE